jgi:hypothetical protein
VECYVGSMQSTGSSPNGPDGMLLRTGPRNDESSSPFRTSTRSKGLIAAPVQREARPGSPQHPEIAGDGSETVRHRGHGGAAPGLGEQRQIRRTQPRGSCSGPYWHRAHRSSHTGGSHAHSLSCLASSRRPSGQEPPAADPTPQSSGGPSGELVPFPPMPPWQGWGIHTQPSRWPEGYDKLGKMPNFCQILGGSNQNLRKSWPKWGVGDDSGVT